MNRNDTIDTGTFTLQREHVLAVMQDQRDASAQVIDDKTGLWRKVRIASVIAMVPLFLVGITLKQAPWMQIAFVAFFVLGIIFKVSSWLIKRGMNRLGTSGTVSRNTVVKALDRRIFKGREAVQAQARFGPDQFELVQDKIRFSAAYGDEKKIGIIFERKGMLQITPGDARGLPDVIFFIPLARVPDPAALMERLQESPSFVFAHA